MMGARIKTVLVCILAHLPLSVSVPLSRAILFTWKGFRNG